MNIVIFGLAITSSWGNGHATTFRSLAGALHRRGHRILFFERDLEWYRRNRDLPRPEFCTVRSYTQWSAIVPEVRQALRQCDVAMLGSYFPDGIAAADEVLNSAAPVKAFYDIDTPVTVAALRQHGAAEYLRRDQVPGFHLYFSFSGGPVLAELESSLGARRAVPLYCSVDPARYRPRPARRFACDLSYMGTYATDRQPKLEELFCAPARRLPDLKFLLAGPQYPRGMRWPANVRHVRHLNPNWHPHFYSSSRITLNVTRRDMVRAGYSPSVRLFEAAACAATLASDNWPGLDEFFTPGREILLPAQGEDMVRYLTSFDESELRRIGEAARERVLALHTSEARAAEFEAHAAQAGRPFSGQSRAEAASGLPAAP